MFAQDKLDLILRRFDEIGDKLSAGADGQSFVALSRERATLEGIVDAIRLWRAAQQEVEDLNAMLADTSTETDMRVLAESETQIAQEKLQSAQLALQLALLPKDEADEKGVILELRAGTGGDEAALFAGDLFRAYQKYAALQGWRLELVSDSPGPLGGFKEIVAEILGKGVYGKLKFESGVHRVQRVPETETQGRIHTSAATVAVLPQAEDVDVAIDDKDLNIETMRAGGAGGQHVNKTESAVRITHLPTGIVVSCQSERSQVQNKDRCMKMLRSKMLEAAEQQRADEVGEMRKNQVGSGDRSEKIRTYNFPQNRVSDHRVGVTLHKLDIVLNGGALQELIDALNTAAQAARLQAAN